MTTARAFRGFRFPAEVILWAVRWYLQFPISYRDLERMLADRGVAVDHTTMYRWVQRFAPELERRLRSHLRPCRGPWHVDATYVRVGGRWRYLYRAVDGTGQTIDFLLRACLSARVRRGPISSPRDQDDPLGRAGRGSDVDRGASGAP
jgi:transposase, IS6 family